VSSPGRSAPRRSPGRTTLPAQAGSPPPPRSGSPACGPSGSCPVRDHRRRSPGRPISRGWSRGVGDDPSVQIRSTISSLPPGAPVLDERRSRARTCGSMGTTAPWHRSSHFSVSSLQFPKRWIVD
jgi:hypothetical protein